MAVEFHFKKEKKTVPCYRSLNLLAHAQIENISLGSQCGGHGVCGKDQIQIDPQKKYLFSPPSMRELHHLGEEKIKQGWRLACQCFPAEDQLEIIIKTNS